MEAVHRGANKQIILQVVKKSKNKEQGTKNTVAPYVKPSTLDSEVHSILHPYIPLSLTLLL